MVKKILSYILYQLLSSDKHERDLAYYRRIEGIDKPLPHPARKKDQRRWYR